MVVKPGVPQFRPRPPVDSRWQEHAACIGVHNPEIFFEPDRYTEALALCQTCPVKAQCWELGRGQTEGVWGGRVKQGYNRSSNQKYLLRPCGTEAAYRRHQRYGQTPCRACAEAHSVAKAARKGKRA